MLPTRIAILTGAVALAAGALVPTVPGVEAADLTVSASSRGTSYPVPNHDSWEPVRAETLTLQLPTSRSGIIEDIDFRIDGSACTGTPGAQQPGLVHPFVMDLEIWLQPSGGYGRQVLGRGVGGGGADMCQTVFDDEAATAWGSGSETVGAPFAGTFRPAAQGESLEAFEGEALPERMFVSFDNFSPAAATVRAFTIVIRLVGGQTETLQFRGDRPVGGVPRSTVSIPVTVDAPFTALTDVDLRFDGDDCAPGGDPGLVGLYGDRLDMLRVALTSPSGTTVQLHTSYEVDPVSGAVGPTGAHLCSTTLTDEAPYRLTHSTEPLHVGSWRPAQPLALFDGEDPNGQWTLTLSSDLIGDPRPPTPDPPESLLRQFTVIVTGDDSGIPSTSTTPDTELSSTTEPSSTGVSSTAAPATDTPTTDGGSSSTTPPTTSAPSTTEATGTPTGAGQGVGGVGAGAPSTAASGAMPQTGGSYGPLLTWAAAVMLVGAAMLVSGRVRVRSAGRSTAFSCPWWALRRRRR